MAKTQITKVCAGCGNVFHPERQRTLYCCAKTNSIPADVDPRSFWPMVDLGTSTICWRWKGTLSKFGHGRFRFAGKSYYAHRVAWTLINGQNPAGKMVCHTCDNPLCCNPSHLFVGSSTDNNRDRASKNRGGAGRSYGEDHGCSKLTTAQAMEIKAATGRHEDIGARFGVRGTTVCRIKSGKRWPHLFSAKLPG